MRAIDNNCDCLPTLFHFRYKTLSFRFIYSFKFPTFISTVILNLLSYDSLFVYEVLHPVDSFSSLRNFNVSQLLLKLQLKTVRKLSSVRIQSTKFDDFFSCRLVQQEAQEPEALLRPFSYEVSKSFSLCLRKFY